MNLARQGLHLVVVPLDHDPEAHTVMPNAVQVVVCHG
jgi:hypothetical protein